MSDATIIVKLGEREYTLVQPPIKIAKAWRSLLREPFDKILGGLSQIRELNTSRMQDLSVPTIVGVVQDLLPVLITSPDEIAELVFAYSMQLQNDREHIENTANDSEMLAAFVAIVRQAYPLETLTALLGRGSRSTSSNSPAPSGRLVPTS